MNSLLKGGAGCCGFQKKVFACLCQVEAVIITYEVVGVVVIVSFECKVPELDLFDSVHLLIDIPRN